MRTRILSLLTGAALFTGLSAPGQTITNPGFETDTFGSFPGYISGNSAITGWTAGNGARAGINTSAGPFADNGAIPAGSQVALIQNDVNSFLSTVITDLTPATAYKVVFRANARNGNNPKLRISIDGAPIMDMDVSSVGGANAYRYVAFDFTATAASHTMTLTNDAGGDNTLLIDDFQIAASNNRWSYAAWNNNASSGVDASYNYSHAYNFGSGANALVNGVVFTGAGGGNPAVSGRFSTAGFGSTFPNDGNNVTDNGGSRTLANDFAYGGPVQTITLNGLVPGREYIATVFGVGFDNAPAARAATFSANGDYLTVDVDHYGNNNGVRVSYRYTADITGSATLTYEPTSPNVTGSFHTYAFCNRETTPRASWGYSMWTSDASSGISAVYSYTHAYNFGSGSSPTVNGVAFTGVPGGNPTVSGKFSVAGMGNAFGGDGRAGVSGAGAAIASDFIYGGNPGTITVNNLTPGEQYVFTLFTSAWDPAGSRFIEFSAGSDRRTIDQDVFNNTPSTGVLITYAYTADATGTLVVQTRPYVGGNSMHLYGFSNRGLNPAPLAPVITLQPVGICVAQGLNVTLRTEGYGEPTPAYQWLSNGVPITDQTNASLALAPAVAGDYQCVLANSAASVTSVVATVRVGLAMVNPSFEADTFAAFPGYVSGNGPITGWASLPNHGINTAAGPFADNGTIPHGGQVAFLQGAGTLSQTVSGFTPGNDYYIEYFENARTGGAIAGLSLTVSDGVTPLTIVPTHNVTRVGAAPYVRVISYGFVASASSLTLTFTKSDAVAGDSTALIDNVCILPLPPGTAPVILVAPQNTYGDFGGSASFSAVISGSSPLSFQWRKEGADISGATSPVLALSNLSLADDAGYSLVVGNSAGSATSAVARLTVRVPLTNLFNTGVDATGAPLAAAAVDPHYTLVVNPDSASPDSLVMNDGFPIAPAGPYIANNSVSKWVGPRADVSSAASGDYTYRVTVDLTGRDPSDVRLEGNWTSDNTGLNILVNGVSTGISQGGNFGIWNPFTLSSGFVSGVNTIDFRINNAGAGYTGLRVEFTKTHARLPAGTAPVIAVQPQGRATILGETVVLSSIAIGSTPLDLQWYKDGSAIPGQKGTTLTLPNNSPADDGGYTLIANNTSGSATSSVATLQQIYLPIATLFSSGLDDLRAPVAGGLPDPHYEVTASADLLYPAPVAATVFNDAYPVQPGVYLLNNAISRWVSVSSNSATPAEGTYVFRTTFVFPTDMDPDAVRITGKWAMDNEGSAILLNGVNVGVPVASGFQAFTSFTITNGVLFGSNTLDFVINNAGPGVSPMGFRVEISGYAPSNPPVAPVITSQPASQTVQDGSTATPSVTTAGGRPTYYQWYFEGFELIGENGPSLVISPVAQLDHQGQYWVVLSNNYGGATSAVAVLTVNLPPEAGTFSTATLQDSGRVVYFDQLLATCGDLDGDTLSVTNVGSSTNGATVIVVGTNALYVPLPGFVGRDEFPYTISDGRGGSAVGTVVVDVYPADGSGLRLTSALRSGADMDLTFAGLPGRTYVVQRALEVTGPWTNILSSVADPLGNVSCRDTNSAPSKAFYRTVTP